MATFRKKTREELVDAFKRAVNRKHEWERQAQEEFADMRMRKIVI